MLERTLNNQFVAVRSGPWGQVHTVGITSAPIVDVPCDAYAVFHPVNSVSEHGVARSIAFSGGATGLGAYRDALSARTTPQRSGELYVTPSGGGKSASLFHMVDGFHKLLPEGMSDVKGMFSYLLLEADHRDVMSLAIPPLGLHKDEGLTPEVSASILFGVVHDYWKKNPSRGPYNVFVPLNGRDPRPYEEALERIFGEDEQVAKLDGDAAELAREFGSDAMTRLLEGLDDPDKTRPLLTFLREAVASDPSSIDDRVMERLARIAEKAPAIGTRSGSIVGRDSIPHEFHAMSILSEVARSNSPRSKSASMHLAQIGWKRRSARRGW